VNDHAPHEDQVVHEYDGIIELDNQLPRWWLGILYATIAFAVAYWVGYEVLGSLPSTATLHQREIAQKRAAEAELLRTQGPATDASLVALSKDPATLDQGKTAFAQNCSICHEQNGSGKVGPNLTDKAWLHGGRPENIYRVIQRGVDGKGMPSWGPQLGEEKVRALAAYVVTLKGKNLPGKAPQGVEEN